MHIVYYFEPWIELERPYIRYHNVRYQMGHQAAALIKAGHKVTFLIGDATFEKCAAEGYGFEGGTVKIINQRELQDIFEDYLSGTISMMNRTATPSQIDKMAALVQKKLEGEPAPDAFISFLSPAEFVRTAFSDCLVLYTEFGIFSRTPFPRSFYFDPNGMFRDSYLRKNEAELKKLRLNDQQALDLTRFRRHFLHEGIMENNPLINLDLDPDHQFDQIILLPLQFSEYFGFDSFCDYKNQFDFLTDVLTRVPDNVGVVVSEHTGWKPVVTEHNEDFLKEKFPNFVHKKEIYQYTNASQFLIPLVDGVLSLSSSVGLQALLWGKPIFCEWDTHLKAFSEVDDIKEIGEFFKQDRFVPHDAELHHLLTHYYFTEQVAYNGKRFSSWLQKAILGHRQGNAASIFDSPLYKKGLNSILKESRIPTLKKQIADDQKKNGIVNGTEKKRAREFSQESLAKIRDAEVVSFDVFDTLLVRPFKHPHELFLFMEKEVQSIVSSPTFEFHKVRRLAEHMCRQESDKEEVNIDDIYEKFAELTDFDFTPNLVSMVKQLEIETELALCRPRQFAKQLYDYASSLNKRIIIISDFYLHGSTLAKLLEKNDFVSHERLFCSSDLNLTKKSGSLYPHILEELGVKPKSILHIGDNWESDIVNALRYKIKTLETPKTSLTLTRNASHQKIWTREWNRNVFPTQQIKLSHAIYFGLIANKLFDNPHDHDKESFFNGHSLNLGYTALGVLLFGFVKHVIHKASQANVNKLYFLSRDGWILKKCYDLFKAYNPDAPESVYLKVSRKALTTAGIRSAEDFVKSLETPFEQTTVRNLLQSRYGINDLDAVTPDMLEQAGLASLDQQVHPVHQLVYLKKLFKNLYPHVSSHFSDMHRAFRNYLDQMGLSNNEHHAAVVDIGYAGSLQRALIEDGIPGLHGFYFLTHLKAKQTARDHNVIVDGFVGQYVDHQQTSNPFCHYVTLFETIFSHRAPSLHRYELNSDGTTRLVFENQRYSPERQQVVESVQNGALAFIDDLLQIVGGDIDAIEFSVDFSSKTLMSYFRAPTAVDSSIFNGIEFEDAFSAKMDIYVIADILGALSLNNGELTEDQIEALMERSKWAEGARSLIPAFEVAPAQKRVQQTSTMPKASVSKKLAKLRRNPFLFFYDSKVPFLRPLRHLFS